MLHRLLTLLASLIFLTTASADEVPIVRMEIEPEVVSVGEPVELRITVLVPTWFAKPPIYPSFEMANAMTRLPPDSSYPTSERVGAETWSGIVRSYEIVPLIGATYRFDPKTVAVTWANPETSRPLTRDVRLPAAEFRAVVPPGAEALDPYLAGSKLTITREIEGEIEGLSVGDALVVRYTAELEGLAAVFLPPMFSDPRAEGAAVYAKAPVFEDGNPARRVETLTFVMQSGGEITLPGVELEWWNTTTGAIETASVTALSLPVSGTLLPLVEPGSRSETGMAVLLLAALGAGVVTARRWFPWLRARWQLAEEARLDSEAHAFGLLRNSLRGKDPRAIHRALLLWLGRLQPGLDARGFVRDHGDTALKHGVEGVIAALYARANVSFDGDNLESGFKTARRHLLRSRAESERSGLPPLNR